MNIPEAGATGGEGSGVLTPSPVGSGKRGADPR